ncbi:beta-amylase 2, chloroplastic [Typha angustifolia]|uniref:beta-amylase 2, chloroplastic n=1 Tax=Typha angustifolia TaxID=59011 RepID=UPI003C2E07A2
MAQEMGKLGGTSEEEDDELEETEMEVKEEEEDDGRGISAAAAAMGNRGGGGGRYFHRPPDSAGGQMDSVSMASSPSARRSRPKEEKERTKLRERHRRAITARILAGLRRHGNYNLRVRADINEVIAALAREAGWVVLPDGTTFPSSQTGRPTAAPPATPHSAAPPLRGVSPATAAGFRSVDHRSGRLRGIYTPARCHVSSSDRASEDSSLLGGCMDSGADKQVIERDFAGTTSIPVYVMLPLGVINMKCEVVDPEGLMQQLRILKSINVDGVMVDCWWGIVEGNRPLEYNWKGYKQLFQMVRELKLKLQVVMSFHECGGNVGDDVNIPLPHWVLEIGRSNPDIFFTDKEGRRNYECLSWGIDNERVLLGRTALEVYFEYMRSFRVEFNEFFEDGIISEIEVGLGPCGELRYPSYPVKHGWRYPGIGEFQCFDQYLLKSLKKTAEERGHSFWARGPENAGSYNSQPHDTDFFCDGGDYDSYYGRFFLGWYSQVLVDHAAHVLLFAKLAFKDSPLAVKISGVHWWYKTASHAAELTAGFNNSSNRDGYAPIAAVLKKYGATLNFTCVELRTLDQHDEFPEAMADPEGLVWQVLNAAWDVCIPVASENALPCYDRDGYNKILDTAKPYNDPDGRHLLAFTYLRLSPVLMERENFLEFERFVKRMHGEAVLDFQL